MDILPIRRAILSVTDKSGLVEFATFLTSRGVELISTGGTQKALEAAGLPVTAVSTVTGFPEILGGRVKTLHPKIHGALLGIRSNPEHVDTMKKHGIEPIDMIVVNLYPFRETISKPGCTFEDAIENIDIGGPTMLRSASKNFQSVTVVIDPADYPMIIETMKKNNGEVSAEINLKLAYKVFKTTSDYDRMISDYLKDQL